MQRFHVTILFITIVAISTWFFTYYRITPWANDGSINLPPLTLFLGSLGLGIAGMYTILSYLIKIKINPSWNPKLTTRTSMRQGILLGGGVVFFLSLSLIQALNPVTATLTILTFIALEIFFRH